jgi:hypothetical protein
LIALASSERANYCKLGIVGTINSKIPVLNFDLNLQSFLPC